MVVVPLEVPYTLNNWVEEAYLLERQGAYTDHSSIADVRSGMFIQWDTSEFAVVYNGRVLTESFIWGPGSYPKTTRFVGGVKAVVLILRPLSLCSVFGPDATRLLDTTAYIDDQVPGFQEKVQKARTVSDIFALVHTEFFASVKMDTDEPLFRVIQTLHSTHAHTDIHVLCARMGMTERSLERKLKSLSGLSPKAFQNIARFQAVYRHLSAGQQPLIDLVYSHHFSDHSHFTREFKRYAGFLPSKMHRFKNTVV